MNLKELKLKQSFESIVSHSKLKSVYEDICAALNCKYPDAFKTPSEKFFSYILSNKTKLKFYTSVWIGRRNVDILIPSIKGHFGDYHFGGIVYEIDGSIHNKSSKMRYDSSLSYQLSKLNILVKCVLNEDFKELTFISDFAYLLKCPRMSSRERKRLWRNIYIYTIYKNSNRSELETYFGHLGALYIQRLGESL